MEKTKQNAYYLAQSKNLIKPVALILDTEKYKLNNITQYFGCALYENLSRETMPLKVISKISGRGNRKTVFC